MRVPGPEFFLCKRAPTEASYVSCTNTIMKQYLRKLIYVLRQRNLEAKNKKSFSRRVDKKRRK
jgi:hypothetical protein